MRKELQVIINTEDLKVAVDTLRYVMRKQSSGWPKSKIDTLIKFTEWADSIMVYSKEEIDEVG